MTILFNSNLNENKKLIFLLKEIFGLSQNKSLKICKTLGVDPNITINKLTQNNLNSINSIINLKYRYFISGDLKKKIYDDIKLLKTLNTYKGARHTYKLPVNGQRTHTNAKTQR